jgi:hypothetical protein
VTALLNTARAAQILGLTPAMVRKLDAILCPTITAAGWRLFEQDRVERFAATRAAERLTRRAR